MKRLFGALALAMVLQSVLTVDVADARAHRHRQHQWHHHHRGAHLQQTNRAAKSSPPGSFFGSWFGGSDPDVVSTARSYLGSGAVFGRSTLWCATFVNYVLEKTGRRGTHSDAAMSFASYGRPLAGPQVGAIAYMGRRGGGHVGIVSGIDAHGNPIIISGNHLNRVREAPYPRSRILGYRAP